MENYNNKKKKKPQKNNIHVLRVGKDGKINYLYADTYMYILGCVILITEPVFPFIPAAAQTGRSGLSYTGCR